MQFPAKVLNELSCGASHIGDQRVTGFLHTRRKNYTASSKCSMASLEVHRGEQGADAIPYDLNAYTDKQEG